MVLREPTAKSAGLIPAMRGREEWWRCLFEQSEEAQVICSSRGELFRPNPAVCGAAILGDGRVGLILDVNHLVKTRPVPLARAA